MSPEEVEAAIREEIEALAATGPEAEETARARIQVETALAFHRESPAQIAAALTEATAQGDWKRFARELVTLLTTGLPLSFPDEYPRRLRSVTREAVMEAIRRHLHPNRLVVAAAGSLRE